MTCGASPSAIIPRWLPMVVALVLGNWLGLAGPSGAPQAGEMVGLAVLLALFTGLAKTSTA